MSLTNQNQNKYLIVVYELCERINETNIDTHKNTQNFLCFILLLALYTLLTNAQ